jgi:hypothetical protein
MEILGCYTFFVVEYIRLGRKLGIGTRIAAKILRERAHHASSSTGSLRPTATAATSVSIGPSSRQKRPVSQVNLPPRNVSRKSLSRGMAAGGRGFWKSFAHAAGALWHQITGVFFAIFAIFFLQCAWHLHAAWRSGPDHRHFVIYGIIGILFAYFSMTAFLRGSRSQRRR